MRPFIDLLRAITKHIKKNLKSAQTYREKVGCENGNTSLTCMAIKLENLKGILPKKFFLTNLYSLKCGKERIRNYLSYLDIKEYSTFHSSLTLYVMKCGKEVITNNLSNFVNQNSLNVS